MRDEAIPLYNSLTRFKLELDTKVMEEQAKMHDAEMRMKAYGKVAYEITQRIDILEDSE